jgi:hypothetical protein
MKRKLESDAGSNPPACSAFAKLQSAYDDPKPVRLTPGEAASIFRSLRNQEITAENVEDSAAGNFGDISWQNH